MRLTGKIGIVTAAGSGMGRAGALRFAREGAKVAVVDVAASRVDEVVREITVAGGTAHGIVADLTKDDDSRRIVWETRDRFKGLDPNLRKDVKGQTKQRAWFLDQYKHPHESKHTIGEVLGWLRDADLEFVKSLPRSIPGRCRARRWRGFGRRFGQRFWPIPSDLSGSIGVSKSAALRKHSEFVRTKNPTGGRWHRA